MSADCCISQRWMVKATGEEVADVGGFGLLEADPCWQYNDRGTRGGAEHHYPTMSLAELIRLPVEDLAAEDAALFMWATWPLLPDAFALMKAWGFRFKNCGLIWVKTNKVATETPFVGVGHWTRGNTEPCLLGIRGKPQRMSKAVQQLMMGEELIVAPIGQHSAKPIEAKNRMVELMGDVPSIELFARSKDPRFESWGNQVDETISLEYR